MEVKQFVLFLLIFSTEKSVSSYSVKGETGSKLVPLIPQQSCYYESYHKRLACVCKSMDMMASLDLKLAYFVYNSGNEIKEVLIRQCRRMSIRLDFTGVDSTNYPIHFQAIEQLDIEYITFEPLFQDRQDLELHFYNVQLLNFIGLYVMNSMKLKAVNVKEARFWNSTFAHIPVGGFEVSRAKLLNIKDSIFLRVSPRSVLVEKTKEVYVSFNEMTINALEVVYATDGSHLFISCNRILNRPISPECSKVTTTIPTTTTTETTTTSSTTTSPVPAVHDLGRDDALGSKRLPDEERGDRAISGEMIGGIVAGILVIVAMLLIFLFARHRQNQTTKVPDLHSVGTEMTEKEERELNGGGSTPPPAPALPPESSPRLNGLNKTVRGLREGEDPHHPKFASPVWMEEIQNNKIFNRQKRLLSEERLRDLSDEQQVPLTQPQQVSLLLPALAEAILPEPPAAFKEEEDRKENSRTESDDDTDLRNISTVGFHKHHHIQLETQI